MIKPYIKWIGNKYKLLPFILSLIPEEYNDYYEPFVGSGSVFYNIHVFGGRKYFLSDLNKHLVNCHKIVANDLDGLKKELKYFSENDDDDFYKNQRLLTTRKISGGARSAARLIYFNRRAYGGMWRVNSSGQFNVPKSHSQQARLWNDSITICSAYLQEANILFKSYDEIFPQQGDFVFLDPPYYPLSKTSNFTSYTVEEWTHKSHENLMSFLHRLDKRGVKFLMTNNECDFVINESKKLGFNIDIKKVHRFIDALSYRNGTKKDKRQKVGEAFIYNYKKPKLDEKENEKS